MQTIKQSVYVDFKAVELEDAMKVAPLMDALNHSLSEEETCTIQMPKEAVCNVLKTLSDFGFRMSDGSCYKEPSTETNLPSPFPSETETDLIHKGTKLTLMFKSYDFPKVEIVKIVKNHLNIGLREAKDAVDTQKITLPHDVPKDTYNSLCFELNKFGIVCYVDNTCSK